MTHSELLAQLMTFDFPTAAIIDRCVGGDWRPAMRDLITLGLVRRSQATGGRRIFRVIGWHPTAVYCRPGTDRASLKARGMLRKTPGHATQIQAAYREWRLYA